MKKAVIYMRWATADQDSCDRQRDEIVAKFGHTHEIVGEYRDVGGSGLGLKRLLEDSSQGNFGVVVVSDLARLTRWLTPEIVKHLVDSGVHVVTLRAGEIAQATLSSQHAKTYLEWLSMRTKAGIRAAKERRRAAPKAR